MKFTFSQLKSNEFSGLFHFIYIFKKMKMAPEVKNPKNSDLWLRTQRVTTRK